MAPSTPGKQPLGAERASRRGPGVTLTRRALLASAALGAMSGCLGGRRAEVWEPLGGGVAALLASRDRLLWVYASESAALEQRLASAEEPLALKDNLVVPHHLAADDEAAYVATDSGVVRVPLVGVGGTLVAAEERGAYRVAVDERQLYWLLRKEGAVLRSDHHGGGRTVVAEGGPWASSLALDPSYLYWGTAEIVRRVPKDGGEPEVILRTARPLIDLAVDRERLWWLSTDELGCVAKDGSDPRILARHLEAPACLTLGRGAVYWTDGQAGADGEAGIGGARIARLSSWGGPVQTVVARCHPQAIAVQGPHLYWADAVERAILRVHG